MESSEIVVWEKILALSPILTLSPMMVKAPIDTFLPNIALSETIAEESIPSMISSFFSNKCVTPDRTYLDLGAIIPAESPNFFQSAPGQTIAVIASEELSAYS